MSDQYDNHHVSLESPAVSVQDITPSAADLDPVPRAIYVGGAGDITVTMQDDTVATLSNVVGGMIYAVRAKKVTAATATGLVGLS